MRSLPILCIVLPAVQAVSNFGLTGPDADEPLDLSKPVEITWTNTEGNVEEPLASALNLWFYAVGSGKRGTIGKQIGTNLSFSAESYRWNPSRLIEDFRDSDWLLSSEKKHYFEANLIGGGNGRVLAEIPSDNFLLGGIDDILGNAGESVAVSKVMVGFVAGLAILRGLL